MRPYLALVLIVRPGSIRVNDQHNAAAAVFLQQAVQIALRKIAVGFLSAPRFRLPRLRSARGGKGLLGADWLLSRPAKALHKLFGRHLTVRIGFRVLGDVLDANVNPALGGRRIAVLAFTKAAGL